MAIEEKPESVEAPEPEAVASTSPEEQEAADFITGQVLDKGATFFEG
jgi:hypothetical protein